MSLLSQLNEVQAQAVSCTEGPVMIIAGAGSGKTRVLTYRIAHLLDQGVPPYSILALTFTNKASKSMRERIGGLVSTAQAQKLYMGTFHSVFSRILRIEAEKIGYPTHFTIYDTEDVKSVLKEIVKELQLSDEAYKINGVMSRISSAKNNLMSAQSYMQNTSIYQEDMQNGRPKMGLIYQSYEQKCKNALSMDFDDLLFKMNVLLRDCPDVLLKYQDRFKYILVDEYQDTNYSQYVAIKKLAARHRNICIVGDDAQSIYSFRGANIQNILNFQKDYPETNVFKLEQNYRSTQAIVQAANVVISNNKEQLKKTVWTDNKEGDKIHILKGETDNQEAEKIAQTIVEHRYRYQLANKEIAILYRTNAQSRPLEEALRRLNIPYRIFGGLSFYKRKEIKDAIAYFRLCVNVYDTEALKRVINYPARGIGKTSLDKIFYYAHQQQVQPWDILSDPHQLLPLVGKLAFRSIYDFVQFVHQYQKQIKELPADQLGKAILEKSGLVQELHKDRTPEGVSKYENIQSLLGGMKDFCENHEQDEIVFLDQFLQEVSLLTDADEDDAQDEDKVSLMTIHAAKGLEYTSVFIAGMEENLFPSQFSVGSAAELEEERRLFYVALTRAEKYLTISFAEKRYKWSAYQRSDKSRFLKEIPVEVIHNAEVLGAKSNPIAYTNKIIHTSSSPNNLVSVDNVKPKTPLEDVLKYQVGMEVEHHKFGAGKIVQIEGPATDRRATIFFPEVGQKKVILNIVKLIVL